MKISIFGLGYVGAVSCGCFASDGFDVIGVDVNQDKVDQINRGHSPITEERIGELLEQAVKDKRLTATADSRRAVEQSDISLVSVGTPSQKGGGVDVSAVVKVCGEIGQALASKDERHLVVIRSTVPPGTVRGLAIPALEKASGKKAGEGFGVCFNPEFLREGSSVRDHYDPPFTVIGGDDPDDIKKAAELYRSIQAELFETGIEEAEMIKYVCNAFHALKATFANEVGILSQSFGVDSHRVMEIVCADKKLNISPSYMKPGFAFGGSCLPKDLRALTHHGRMNDLELPLLDSVLVSNRAQVDRAIDLIRGLGSRKVSMLGLSFKAGTDDLRESPNVAVAEALIGKGFDLRIYDRHLSMARLVGANRRYIEEEIPHISSLLVSELPAALVHGDILVIGNHDPEFGQLCTICRPGQQVVDFAHMPGLAQALGENYHGITW